MSKDDTPLAVFTGSSEDVPLAVFTSEEELLTAAT